MNPCDGFKLDSRCSFWILLFVNILDLIFCILITGFVAEHDIGLIIGSSPDVNIPAHRSQYREVNQTVKLKMGIGWNILDHTCYLKEMPLPKNQVEVLSQRVLTAEILPGRCFCQNDRARRLQCGLSVSLDKRKTENVKERGFCGVAVLVKFLVFIP